MVRRHELTDEQCARLQPLRPPQKPPIGRPSADLRRLVNAILGSDRTGAPWRDLPERYGPVGTVSSRFYRWRQAGVWDRVLVALQEQADQAGEVDWQTHYVDGSVIRAHQHAAGAKKGARKPTRPLGAVRAASAPEGPATYPKSVHLHPSLQFRGPGMAATRRRRKAHWRSRRIVGAACVRFAKSLGSRNTYYKYTRAEDTWGPAKQRVLPPGEGPDRHQLLRKLDTAWAGYTEAYAGLAGSQLTDARVTGDWSVTDIVAHVIAGERGP